MRGMWLMIEIPEDYYQCLQDIPDDKLMIDTLLIKHGKVINVESKRKKKEEQKDGNKG